MGGEHGVRVFKALGGQIKVKESYVQFPIQLKLKLRMVVDPHVYGHFTSRGVGRKFEAIVSKGGLSVLLGDNYLIGTDKSCSHRVYNVGVVL